MTIFYGELIFMINFDYLQIFSAV